MKIRNGFVSNSSSSSFLFIFPKDANVEGLMTYKEWAQKEYEGNYYYEEYDTAEDMMEDHFWQDEIRSNVGEDEKFIILNISWNDTFEAVNTIVKALNIKSVSLPL